MFSGCISLENINLSSFNTSKVTNMGAMFMRCSSLESLDLSSFDTRAILESKYTTDGTNNILTGLSGFASLCPALTEINFGANFGRCYARL
jgi:surface protein